MPHSITIYEKPTCSTCRRVMLAFKEVGIPFESVNYIIDPVSKSTLKKIVAGLDVPASELVRINEQEFKTLGLDIATLSPSAIVDLLAEHPAIMQRPVLDIDGRYYLGRPVEKVEQLLKTLKP